MSKKVRFNLKFPKAEESLVIFRFCWKSHQLLLSAGFSLPTKYWDSKAQRVRRSSDYPIHAQLNARLNRIENETLKLHYEYHAKGIVPGRSEFIEALQQRLEIRHDKGEVTPISFIQELIQEGQVENPKYRQALGHLEAYQKKRRRKLTFSDLTESFRNDFTSYLFSLNVADSTAHKMIVTLKAIIRKAEQRGIADNVPLLKVNAGVQARSKDHVYLTEREIESLFRLELSSERLERVRDLFLIGCLTGMRFSDYSQIKRENIQSIEHEGKTVKCLVRTTQKTKGKVTLPLVNPMLQSILKRHNWQAPKAMSNQKMNDYLKELCKIAGFDQEIEVNEYRAGKHERKVYPKYELIATHTARRSFATNAYKRGLPVPDIMRFTGHTTVTSFLKYIKVTGEETAVVLSDHEFFTGKVKLRKVD